jgi:uncharacterized protein YdeI (YjbR/CyaY-like superfamily)
MADQPDLVIVADVVAWRAWLDSNESTHDGMWLMLAKKGTTVPTSLTYQDALLEALCSGWIDGQVKSVDAHTYKQRFTPRRARSLWSLRNVGLVAQLESEGRMRERGRAEVVRAQVDGRWDRAYPGPADAKAPEDFIAALEAHPGASDRFNALDRQGQYATFHQILTATTPAVRVRRIARAVERLMESDG